VRVGTLRLCRRCGEEIELANDLDREPDNDRERHIIFAAGGPRQLPPAFWQLFVLLYRCRGSVVPKALLYPRRESVRQLRKLLAGSRYQIVNYRTIGYELIVTPEPVGPKAKDAWERQGCAR
jgi:hypothetical protein